MQKRRWREKQKVKQSNLQCHASNHFSLGTRITKNVSMSDWNNFSPILSINNYIILYKPDQCMVQLLNLFVHSLTDLQQNQEVTLQLALGPNG